MCGPLWWLLVTSARLFSSSVQGGQLITDNKKEILLQNLQTDFGDSKYLEKVDMNDSDKMMPWLDIVDFLFIAKIFCPKSSQVK